MKINPNYTLQELQENLEDFLLGRDDYIDMLDP